MEWTSLYTVLVDSLLIALLSLGVVVVIQLIRTLEQLIGILKVVRNTSERLEYITNVRNWGEIFKGWFKRKKA